MEVTLQFVKGRAQPLPFTNCVLYLDGWKGINASLEKLRNMGQEKITFFLENHRLLEMDENPHQ